MGIDGNPPLKDYAVIITQDAIIKSNDFYRFQSSTTSSSMASSYDESVDITEAALRAYEVREYSGNKLLNRNQKKMRNNSEMYEHVLLWI